MDLAQIDGDITLDGIKRGMNESLQAYSEQLTLLDSGQENKYKGKCYKQREHPLSSCNFFLKVQNTLTLILPIDSTLLFHMQKKSRRYHRKKGHTRQKYNGRVRYYNHMYGIYIKVLSFAL